MPNKFCVYIYEQGIYSIFIGFQMKQLTFIEKTKEKDKYNHYYWLAECSCGNKIKCLKSKRLCEQCRKNAIKKRNIDRENHRLNSIKLNMDYSPENMYFWGFLWADGHISLKNIIFSILKVDMDDIISFIPNLEFFRIYNYHSRESKTRNQKPQTTIQINNKNYYNFLIENGYKNKINLSTNILNNENFYMWVRGFIDGDGCWYLNKKNYTRHFTLSGKKDQGWDFITNCFDDINVKYSIKNRFHSSSNSNSSVVRTSDKNSIKNLYDFVYQDRLDIGLKRKQNKARNIVDF